MPSICSQERRWLAARESDGPGWAMSQGSWRSGLCWLLLSRAFTHLAQWHAIAGDPISRSCGDGAAFFSLSSLSLFCLPTKSIRGEAARGYPILAATLSFLESERMSFFSINLVLQTARPISLKSPWLAVCAGVLQPQGPRVKLG